MYIYINICTYTYIYINICTYIYICIYIIFILMMASSILANGNIVAMGIPWDYEFPDCESIQT